MRYVDADELKKAIDEVHQKDLKANPLWGSIGLNTLNRLIDNAPTVSKDNRPNICFNCEHCCAFTVNSDGEVKIMCNLGVDNCDNQRPPEKWIVDHQENEDALFKHGWKCPVCEARNTYGMPPYCMYCGARLEKADGQE